ncbi:MAG: NAD(P)H-binding protein [Sphingobacteriales bacterium]
MHTVLILGASGLIGSHLVELLLNDKAVDKIYLLLRKPMNLNHPKVEERIVDFNDTNAFKNSVQAVNTVFCCIGTTQKQVKGDNALYRKIDFDIPVNAARFCIEKDATKYILVSAIGANSKSGNFYLKLKGEVEEAIACLPFQSVHFMRPSILMGNRKEFRLGEKIAQVIMPLLSFLIPSKYKPIKAAQVAMAMIIADKGDKVGKNVYEFKDMK